MLERCKGVCGGGNSGLSLRRRSKLLPVATKGKLPEDLWGIPSVGETFHRTGYFQDDDLHNNSRTRWFEDDLQLSFKLSLSGSLPTGDMQSRFAIGEALPLIGGERADPCGLHKTWMTPTIPPATIDMLLQTAFLRATDNVSHISPDGVFR